MPQAIHFHSPLSSWFPSKENGMKLITINSLFIRYEAIDEIFFFFIFFVCIFFFCSSLFRGFFSDQYKNVEIITTNWLTHIDQTSGALLHSWKSSPWCIDHNYYFNQNNHITPNYHSNVFPFLCIAFRIVLFAFFFGVRPDLIQTQTLTNHTHTLILFNYIKRFLCLHLTLYYGLHDTIISSTYHFAQFLP